jgi:heme exporter protein C
MMIYLKILLFVFMSLVIVLSFIKPPPMSGQEWSEASRIFYFHVPQALVSFVAFCVSMVFSVRYLAKRDIIEDSRAAVAAGLGVMFCAVATITGSIFARVAWGSFWNWDPRETSILILLVIYGAYFALRQSIADVNRRAAFSAVYGILAFVTVPFFGFIVPRMFESLHPEEAIVSKGGMELGGYVAFIFFTSIVCFLILFFWLFNIGSRLYRLELQRAQESYDV